MSWRSCGGRSSTFAPQLYRFRAVRHNVRSCAVPRSASYQTSSIDCQHPPQVATSNDTRSTTVAGLVRSIRKQKKVAFAHISDGTILEPVQAILEPIQAKDISNGSYVNLSGLWKTSPGKGQAYEFQVTRVDDIGETIPDDNPIQKKSQSAEFLRSLPHLRMRAPLYSLLARTRSQLISGIHNFYNNARPAGPVIQVHPPLITSSDCEGAGEVFTISPKSSKSVSAASEPNTHLYFRDHKYLTVSTQLHLEAYAAELGDVWTLSPTFRAEESDTPRHLSEFYMLEAEFRQVNSLEQIMSEAQQLLQHIVSNLADSRPGKDLVKYYSDPKYASAEDDSKADIENRWQQVLTTKWPTLTYKDAIAFLQARYDADPDQFVHAPRYETGLQLEHERCLVSEFANNVPLFITHYPRHIKPFYMLPSSAASNASSADADQTVACFDLLFPFGTAEIVGGSLREHRLGNLISTMREKGLIKHRSSTETGPGPGPGPNDDGESKSATSSDKSHASYPFLGADESLGSLRWYADLRRFGTSPHGGFGVGFDRLLGYVSGISNVRDTVGFPRYFGRADC